MNDPNSVKPKASGRSARAPQQAKGGWQATKYLESLPLHARYFALPIGIVEAVLGAMTFFSSDTTRVVVIVLMVVVILVAMTFVYLLERLQFNARAAAEAAPPAPAVQINYNYHVFLSTAMAALKDADRPQRVADIGKIVDLIGRPRGKADIRVFTATAKVKTKQEFDDPNVALNFIVMRLRESRYLALVYSESVPTSALLEAGMALAQGKKSVWFIKQGVKVPYLMQGVMADTSASGLPNVRIVRFNDFADLCQLIEKHNEEYFPL